MKKMLIAAVLLMVPGYATAFPIAVGAVGVGLFGVMALPMALVLAGAVWVYKAKGKGLVPMLALLIAGTASVFLMRDYAQDQEDKAVSFTNADASFLSPSIPFPFVEPAEQSESPQSVTPAEFMAGIADGHFRALKVSTYPSLFMQSGQVAVEDFWRDKDVLINAVNSLGGRVVLVDEYGGIAASVAGAAMRNFGLNVGFLQGGTTALSKFGWEQIDLGKEIGGTTVAVPDYKDWITENPDVFVLGITTDREFVMDGWIFGDRTLSLADFVANYEEIVRANLGKRFFVVGFETNDSGATPIAVNLLSKAGVDVHYVMPNHDEILIKPAYFDAYPNDSRTVSVEDAERYVLHRDDVEFLDFSERPWPIGTDYLKGRYHHLPMSEVATGKLSDFVESLDPHKVYIGLAFDRRTAYHSLLAGELLSKRGVAWLGRFTRASSLTEPFFTVEDLNTEGEQIAYQIRDVAALIGQQILGNGTIPIALLFGLVAALPSLAFRRRMTDRNTVIIAVEGIAYCCVFQAKADYPQLSDAYSAFMITNSICMACVAIWVWKLHQPPIKAFSQFTPKLPAKGSLLNLAAERGYCVPQGFVVAPQDAPKLARKKFKAGQYIVRSAAMGEASDHASTAGLYDSFVATNAGEIPAMATAVFEGFMAVGVDGFALVQPYVEAEWYGVIQLQDNEQCSQMICDIGQAEAITSGSAGVKSFAFPAWDAKRAPAQVRSAATALLGLMADGAYSLEFALKANGSLIILQVNQSFFRACAGIRLKQASSQQVIEVGAAHPDPLSAGIVAGLSPGQIFAFGHRRFCLVESALSARWTLRTDLTKLGFSPNKAKASHLLAWADRTSRSCIMANGCEPEAAIVAAAIFEAGDSIGRMNRVATAMLALGQVSPWETEARPLASSQVGCLIARSELAAWFGMPVAALAGYAAGSSDEDFTADELPSRAILASSPEHWVKDATTILLAIRLSALKPAIDSLIAAGKAHLLLDALKTQVGYWDADHSSSAIETLVQVPVKFADVMLGQGAPASSSRLPAGGIKGSIIKPESGSGNGILLIDRCSMNYLPDLNRAIAVIAREGSVTSHLMQHAAAMKLPVVIDAELPEGVSIGTQVTISAKGVITCA